jgi:hypothetical protein
MQTLPCDYVIDFALPQKARQIWPTGSASANCAATTSDIRIGVGALLRGERNPSQQQEAEHGASRDDVHHLRKNEVAGSAEHSDDRGWKQSVFAAKVQAKIQVLQ